MTYLQQSLFVANAPSANVAIWTRKGDTFGLWSSSIRNYLLNESIMQFEMCDLDFGLYTPTASESLYFQLVYDQDRPVTTVTLLMVNQGNKTEQARSYIIKFDIDSQTGCLVQGNYTIYEQGTDQHHAYLKEKIFVYLDNSTTQTLVYSHLLDNGSIATD